MTFTSDALDAALEIAGRPVLTVEFESSAPSTPLFAKLQDVAPDGTTRPISRNEAVLPGKTLQLLRLPLSDIAYRFRPGHRIQLQLQSSDYPYYLVHPGTDENPWTARKTMPSTQTVKIGGTAGASLTLPVFGS